jgi:hypothetical protein
LATFSSAGNATPKKFRIGFGKTPGAKVTIPKPPPKTAVISTTIIIIILIIKKSAQIENRFDEGRQGIRHA